MNDKQLLLRAAAIQRYLEDHPDSTETLDGIHHFWIRTRGEDSTELTQLALDYLEAAGFVESVTKGGRQIWRRASQANTRTDSDAPASSSERDR